MNSAFRQFARDLVGSLVQEKHGLSADPDDEGRLLAAGADGTVASLALTPVEAAPRAATAASWFRGVRKPRDLIEAYLQCRSAEPFETSLPEATAHISSYAARFLDRLLARGLAEMTDHEACVIGDWVADLDTYTAVKAVESLLNSRADRALLGVAEERDWFVYADHVAIRCGSRRREDARRIADFLCAHFGYVAPQVEGEAFYQFEDGWDACPVYKLLDNGLMLRVFSDESAADHPEQIIQYWNHVYGYTAHHLALRACRYTADGWAAVPLAELSRALSRRGVNTMTPTGEHTCGLLEQVFVRPSHTPDVPAAIRRELAELGAGLEQTIENGKLIELVSRREMTPEFAERYLKLYGIRYRRANPRHSAPIYTYFLPAQAAHVIRSSVETA